MQALIEQGIAFIISLQAMGDWLIAPMQFFSYLGTEDFFFIVLPLVYWCIDSALGLRLAFVLSTSNALNYVFKIAFAGPRPYWISADVKGLWAETTFGVPSGHAQLAVGVWGTIAAYYKRGWGWALAILLIFMIGFSRLYLGAHFPHDVVLGWALGAFTLWLILGKWDAAANWLEGKSLQQKIIFAFVVSMIFVAVGFGIVSAQSDFVIPEEWITNALQDTDEAPEPVDPNGIFTSAGTFFGLATGAAWIMSKGGFSAEGPIQKRALRYIVGLIGILILWMGLGEIFPREHTMISFMLRYLRYALVGFWVSAGAPWAFMRLKLA
jgi:membrane-associated phospholipid phosphatase